MFRRKRYPAPDILGQAMLEHWQGTDKGMIRVKTKITSPQIMDPAIFFREFDEMPAWEKLALELCSGRTLDVGAGAGPHCLWLQEHGLEACGLEVSAAACRVMEERGVEKIIQGSFLDTSDPLGFDTILFLMNGTGLAGSMEGLPGMLRHAKGLLREGGKILIDSTDIMYMYEEWDGSLRLNLNANYYGEMEMWVKYRDMRSHPFIWLYVDPANLIDIAREAGLETTIVFSDETGRYLASLSVSAS